MIDTLKLSKRLVAAHMPAEQAEALADGLAESLKESYVSREFLDARLAALETRLIGWVVGTVGLATLINHWWK
jgi:hypothetical protein